MGVAVSCLMTSLHTRALTEAPLAEFQEVTIPVEVLVSGNNQEQLAFTMMKSSQNLVVGLMEPFRNRVPPTT